MDYVVELIENVRKLGQISQITNENNSKIDERMSTFCSKINLE